LITVRSRALQATRQRSGTRKVPMTFTSRRCAKQEPVASGRDGVRGLRLCLRSLRGCQ
jgi:hypothetical protein